MTATIGIRMLSAESPTWSTEVEALRQQLGAPTNPALFPAHFLQATLPKIGGQIVVLEAAGRTLGAGFLFPRALIAGRRCYTMRWQAVEPVADFPVERVTCDIADRLDATIVPYNPADARYRDATTDRDDLDLQRPDARGAQAIRELQRTIWGASDDALYPADIHALDFYAGTSLLARLQGEPVGFLFGFYRFGGSALPPSWDERLGGALRLESQLLGVIPAARQHGIGFALKERQAFLANQEGIGLVSWTVDPLQYSNAVLNFGRLRALAFDFYPEHYSFRNDLNQVAASRFGITWPVGTGRVRQALAAGASADVRDLRGDRTIPRVNRGPDACQFDLDAPHLAIEIPTRWTALQREDEALARRWRGATDALFQHYLGPNPGHYVVMGAGYDGERRYLLAARVTAELLQHYAE